MVCVRPVDDDASDVTVSLALPLLSRLLVPSSLLLSVRSMKVTLPLGARVLGESGLTVAVKVTGSPKTVGLFDVETLVVVVPWLTDSHVPSLAPLKLTLPVNGAVIVNEPTGRALNESVALPLLSSDLVPMGVTCPAPSSAVKVTLRVALEPEAVVVGVVVGEVTVAVYVTGSP